MDSQQLTYTLLAFLFIALNGFFVLSEFALVKVRKSKLEEMVKDKIPNSKLALKMTSSIDTYLSATQLGITLASLALGWIGEPAVANLITPLFSKIESLGESAITTIATICTFVIITLFHVVLGEQAPKLIAITKSEKIILSIAKPLYFFWILCFPIIKAFDFIAIAVVRLFGIKNVTNGELAHSEEEIKFIAGESLKGGIIDSMESEIIKNAVDFSDTVAKEIMTPRKDMICLNKQKSLEENLEVLKNYKFTRFPYIDGSKDNVLGMIHIRDIFMGELDHKTINFDKVMRKFIIVPENSSISKILVMMNKERISAALVLDEYGGTAGFVTMEDIIEEILGDLIDEYDSLISQNYKKISDNEYDFNGRFEIEEIEELLNIKFDEETEQLTIGGYVFNLFERLPQAGDIIQDSNCIYEVKKLDGASISLINIKIKDEARAQYDELKELEDSSNTQGKDSPSA